LIAVDSSGWLEYFTDGPHADAFAAHLLRPKQVVTSVISLYEVYKWLKRERSEQEALHAVAAMKRTLVVEVSEEIGLTAGDLSLEFGLAMADALILATARKHGATLYTTDSDFEGVPGAVVLSKRDR
jgi:predicted nucleic acid-binding protein